MSFFQAQQLFEAAVNETDPERNPAMWNMLNGLAKLAQAAIHLESTVNALGRKIDDVQRDVRQIKNATR
jgi:hypothetical protein